MDRVYAQIVDGVVNLVGGAEVGLPHNSTSENIQVVDITEMEFKPQEGWFYVDGEFVELLPVPDPEPAPEPIEDKITRLEEQNLILMDALATTFEELLELRVIVEGGTGA